MLFSTKSTLAGGWNRLRRWNPTSLGEIRLDGGWVDLISSEAKPKISSALADFILASARISFYVRVRIHTKNQQKYLFCSPYTEPSKCEPHLWKELVRFDFTETCKIMQVFLYAKNSGTAGKSHSASNYPTQRPPRPASVASFKARASIESALNLQ